MKPPPTHTLADLRPNTTVRCLVCDQTKPQATAVKFHAHHVCGDCAARLRTQKEKK